MQNLLWLVAKWLLTGEFFILFFILFYFILFYFILFYFFFILQKIEDKFEKYVCAGITSTSKIVNI